MERKMRDKNGVDMTELNLKLILDSQLQRLCDLLDREDYAYKAGYLEAFLKYLADDIQLNKKQLRKLTELTCARVGYCMKRQNPSLVD